MNSCDLVCLCGQPANLNDHEGIYCSTACALRDTLGMLFEKGYTSHYRRAYKVDELTSMCIEGYGTEGTRSRDSYPRGKVVNYTLTLRDHGYMDVEEWEFDESDGFQAVCEHDRMSRSEVEGVTSEGLGIKPLNNDPMPTYIPSFEKLSFSESPMTSVLSLHKIALTTPILPSGRSRLARGETIGLETPSFNAKTHGEGASRPNPIPSSSSGTRGIQNSLAPELDKTVMGPGALSLRVNIDKTTGPPILHTPCTPAVVLNGGYPITGRPRGRAVANIRPNLDVLLIPGVPPCMAECPLL
ncbi:hypothetical protein K439DRAFT_1632275 [Ramaria rubella]|nr:hypothetical protein K439DRAFT_1632275 [Ramaria rubella]